jgi:glycosyltransferase involved in cell wall biosynthesis
MKILFVQPSIPLYRISFFKSLESRFGKLFTVIHSEGDLGELTPSLKYPWSECIGKEIKIGFGFVWQKNLINFTVKKDYIIVVSGNPRYLSTILFVLKAKLFGAKILWWGHYRSSTSKNWRIKLRLGLMKLSDGIIFYTEDEVKRYLISKQRKEFRPIIGLNNGIDTLPIKRLRKKYDSNSRSREILFLGRVTEKASFHVLLNALQHLKIKDITLNVIGNNIFDPYLKLDNYNFNNGVKINYYGKLTDEKKISNIANRCRVFVYPGSIGLSLIHSMAYGLPSLIHSDPLKHMPEIAAFKEGVTGLTFNRNNPEDLAMKLCSMMSNTSQLDFMSKECLNIVENDFNTKTMSKKFSNFVRKFT